MRDRAGVSFATIHRRTQEAETRIRDVQEDSFRERHAWVARPAASRAAFRSGLVKPTPGTWA